MPLHSIEEALADIAAGKMLVVVDDEDRENEGDLVMAAQAVTAEAINFMSKYGRGLICASITQQAADRLKLYPMVQDNKAPLKTAFTVSVDAKDGITTGISAYDRALTIALLAQPDATAELFVTPGHIFPLIAQEGGVLARGGHTEASVDLAELAGLHPSGVICEIMHEDGTMARMPDLITFAQKHELKVITIKDLIAYRKKVALQHIEQISMPTLYGMFQLHVFFDRAEQTNVMALVKGELSKNKPIITRIHSSCMTSEIWKSKRCDCDNQLIKAMQEIEKEEKGIIIYLQQEGRGIGLLNKIKAYKLQDNGLDTVEANHQLGFQADLRDYSLAAQVLNYFTITRINLLTNNPKKIEYMLAHGITVEERLPLEIKSNANNNRYLCTKKYKLSHLLSEF